MDYGLRFADIIIDSHLSPIEIAEAIGITPEMLKDQMEEPYPSLNIIEKVCGVLRISLGEFFCPDECPRKEKDYMDIPEELIEFIKYYKEAPGDRRDDILFVLMKITEENPGKGVFKIY